MKKQNILAAAIVLAATGASTTASAVPYVGDYQEATSAFEDAFVNGNFSAISGRDEEGTQSSYSLGVELDYDKVFSSPNRNTTLLFDATGTADKGSEPGDESTTYYDAAGSINVDNYINPGNSKLFWYGGAEIEAVKDAESIGSEITVGLGYGRVVNVTPMARSIRIIENLIQKGFLTSDPSNAVYQQVAKIIDKEDEYESTHGRDYEQFWVQDIQAAIQSSGAVNGPLNARAILSSFDVLTTELISQRRIGWLVRAGIGVELTSLDGEEDGNPLFELIGEYHKPFGNKWQFSNIASFETTLRDDDDLFEVDNAMSLTYELTDTVDWINTWDLNHIDFGDADATTNTFSSTFLYEINNQLDFNVTASIIDFEDASNDERLTMGLRYRLK